jgi:protein involved in polysaccharide export with SLBB domain
MMSPNRHLPLWALLLPALLVGCESTNVNIGQRAIPAPEYVARAADFKPVDGVSLQYQLQPGDAVEVKFYYHSDLNEQLVIGPDNLVALQLVGEVNTAGMSPRQLGEELSRRYAATLRNPQATVILRKYALPRIYVAGEVANPTAHALDAAPMTALQAIIQSGGFRKGAERGNVVVLRNSGSGNPVFIKLDLQGHLEQNTQADILLRPYDIVFVPQKRIAEVAEFFDEYVNKIVPLYRNMGFAFTYNLRNQVVVPTTTPTVTTTPSATATGAR